MPNRLTPFYSKIYYKKENYLKVKTAVFKYIALPIVKVKYISILVYSYIPIFSCFYIPNFLLYTAYVTRLTPCPMAPLVPLAPPLNTNSNPIQVLS